MRSIFYRSFFFFFTLTLGVSGISLAEEIKFARYPNIHKGKITFTYHADIWVADADGTNPYRLTNHVGRDIYPRFSPDGKSVAFSSDRMGNYDIWLVPVEGGKARQLTFHSTSDYLVNWTPKGDRLIFRTSRKGVFASPLYTVSAEGDLPVPMDMDRGYSGMLSPDERYLAFNRNSIRNYRKHYKGNSDTNIWLLDSKSDEIKQLTDTNLKKFRDHVHDAYPMWGKDGLIYFLSERSDVFNIWKISPKGGRPKQVTFHKKDGVQYPSISPDGKTIIYENEFDLWKLEVPGGKPRKITVSLGFEPKENTVSYLTASSKADEIAPSPDGSYVAVGYHGEIFIVPADPKVGEKKQVTASPYRDRYFDYSPDGKHLSYVSDESGEEELWLYDLKTKEKTKVTTSESMKRRTMWSKDSKKLLYVAANSIFILDMKTSKTEEVAHNDAKGFRVSDWSKDGKWLVYSRSRDDYNQDIYLFNIEEKKEYNMTQNPFRDSYGRFSSDEKYLVFASNRNRGVSHLFALPLDKITEDRDDPLLRERKKKTKKPEDKEKKEEEEEEEEEEKQKEEEKKNNETSDKKNDNDKNDEEIEKDKEKKPGEEAKDEKKKKGDEKAKKKSEKKKEPSIKPNMSGIKRRAVQITKTARDVGSVFSGPKGNKVYFTGRDDKGTGLFSIDITGENMKKTATGSFSGLTPTADKKLFFFLDKGAVYKMPFDSSAKKKIDFKFTMTVDKEKEWEQVFVECWRVMKYLFYDEKMHGYDWDAIKARYMPLLPYIGENQDLYDLANEMIGELNASHTGVSGPTRSKPSTYSTKHLGFDMTTKGGHYRVSHILWKGPADKEWIDLHVGDYVLSIDGKKVRAGDNYWKILNHTLNDYVTVMVNDEPKEEKAREIRIKTVGSVSSLKYAEWVEKNRQYVEDKTDDEIAYVHIRAMNGSSLEKFTNEIDRYHNHKGIVVDIRYNRGGNIDQQILEILSRRAYEYWNNRWGSREMGRRPMQMIQGPKVILVNRHSASDSEVTPLGFRDLGLGRIVGNPTNGSVIATGSYRLMNGGSIRTPGSLVVAFDPGKPHNYGTNLENYGVAPDVWVDNTPQDEMKGRDPELDRAIREVLKMLKKGKWRYDQ